MKFLSVSAVAALLLVAAPAIAQTTEAESATAAGLQAIARGDLGRAVRELQGPAGNGDVQAQLLLGQLYVRGGQGVPRDYPLGFRWLREAAGKNNAEALNELARLTAQGLGVERNPGEAANLYRRAAEQGHAGAQHALATLLLRGEGVVKDPVEAAQWLRRAADRGHARAQLQVARLLEAGDQINGNRDEAMQFYRRAASAGLAEARYGLAMMLRQQFEKRPPQHAKPTEAPRPDVRILDSEAIQWLTLAAEQGFAPAQYQLGLAHVAGIEAHLDGRRAARWLRAAADQGLPEAAIALGRLHQIGFGVGKDAGKALMYFEAAAIGGSDEAGALRDELAKQLGQKALGEARRRAREWREIRGLS